MKNNCFYVLFSRSCTLIPADAVYVCHTTRAFESDFLLEQHSTWNSKCPSWRIPVALLRSSRPFVLKSLMIFTTPWRLEHNIYAPAVPRFYGDTVHPSVVEQRKCVDGIRTKLLPFAFVVLDWISSRSTRKSNSFEPKFVFHCNSSTIWLIETGVVEASKKDKKSAKKSCIE